MQREIVEKAVASGKVKIDTSLVYCHYNLEDTTLQTSGYLDFLKAILTPREAHPSSEQQFQVMLNGVMLRQEHGIGLIGASPIAMGLLTSRGPPNWHPANHKPYIIEACNKANEYCKAEGVDISRIAMFFTLANPDIPTTLVTSANPSRMASNVAACYETPSEKDRSARPDPVLCAAPIAN